MKKFKRMLAGLACVLAVCLCTPTAFAAKVIVYFDANAGICNDKFIVYYLSVTG